MPPGENPSGRVQIHPASFRYDSSANSDIPKLRKPASITAAVKPSSCFSVFPLAGVSYLCHHPTTALFSLPTPSDLWPPSFRARILRFLFHTVFTLSPFSFFFHPRETEARRFSRAPNALTSRTYIHTSYFSFVVCIRSNWYYSIYSEGSLEKQGKFLSKIIQ